MELEQIYFIAEIFSAAAVIGTLLYVAVQIRQNTQTVRIAAGQAHVDAYGDVIGTLTNSDSLMQAWARATDDFDGLSVDQKLQVLAFIGVLFRNFEGAWIQSQEGVLDQRFWMGIRRSMADQYAHDGVRTFWSIRSHWFSDEFGQWFTDNVVSKSETSPAETLPGEGVGRSD